MQKKNKHPGIIIFLWIIFLGMVAVVAYLSFQNGEAAKTFGKHTIEYIAEMKYSQGTVTDNQMDTLTYQIRQNGRAIAFFMIGIVGTVTIHASFKRWNWVIRTSVTAVLLVAIAYFTEKLKIYIPSRHYSHEEMLISVTAVVMGFILVSVVTLAFGALKSLFRLIAAAR